MVTVQGKRRTLHRDDVASAVMATDIFDFLVSLVGAHPHGGREGEAALRDDSESLQQVDKI